MTTLRDKVPSHTIGSIDRYVNQRIPAGGFLTAVLENDFAGALSRADHINREALSDIMNYLHHEVPSECWGSPEKVEIWLSGRTA